MARQVYLHVGLPKTATTYLQTIVWDHREEIETQGVRLPGLARHDHLWSSRIVREDAQFAKVSSARRLGAWDRICVDVAAWPGTCLISHEFFGAATAEQAARVVADLAPAEVHLVVTAREPLSLFAASWQESIKNRDTTPMADYSTVESDDPNDIWNWRTLDLRLVLERWAPAFAPEHVHVLPLPGGDAPRRLIWDRFAELVGIDPQSVDVEVSFPNTSMGVVEAETLRRMNFHLDSFRSAIDRGTFIRSFLADERLVPRKGERYWPRDEQVTDARERGRAAVALVRERGFDVIGELDALLVPDELPDRRTPETVRDSEVAEVAVELAATLLHDVRDLRHERRALRAELEAFTASPVKGLVRHRFPGLRDRLRRVLRRST